MTVTELLLSGGPILVVIILVSIYAVYLFVERLLKGGGAGREHAAA